MVPLAYLGGMPTLSMQPCLPSDLHDLRRIALETFTAAFAAQNDPADFQAYLHKAFAPGQLRVEMEHPDTRFYFLLSDGERAGYAKVNTGSAQTEPQDPNALEVERFYIRESFQGRGLGSWMLESIKALATGEGRPYLWLGVWEENTRAIRFYRRHGFVTFGKHPYYIGSDRQMDWMMRLELQAGA